MAAIEYLTVEHLNTKDVIRVFSKITIHSDLQHNGTPCWIWSGGRESRKGYGRTHWINKNYITHRLIWAWAVAPLPRGQKYGELDHLCKRPSCCNPIHLEHVPTRINILRSNAPTAINARKTHCIHGHELSIENVYIDPHGGRSCRRCVAVRNHDKWKTQSDEARLKHNEKLQTWRANHRLYRNAQERQYRLRKLLLKER